MFPEHGNQRKLKPEKEEKIMKYFGVGIKNSVQTRLNLILIVTITTIFTGYTIFNYVKIKSSMEEELNNLTDFCARQLSESLKIPLWDMNEESIYRILNSAMLEKQFYAIVIEYENRILYGRVRDENWNVAEPKKDISGDYYLKTREVSERGHKLGTIKVYFSPKFMRKKLRDAMAELIFTIIILNLALVFSLYFSVKKSIILPVSRIAENVRVISSGNLSISVHSEREDEIGQLATDVESMRLSIKDLTENLENKVRERTKQLREARDALWGEMELAKKIQTVLLPAHPTMRGYEIRASMIPAVEVGGDYYDVITVDDFQWLVIGDVSGHGVPAGLIMMMTQTAIHNTLMENPGMSPANLLVVINKILSQNIKRLGEMKYMTLTVLAAYKDGKFSFAGLHQDILVYRAREKAVDAIETRGFWIGIEPDIAEMVMVDELHMDIGDIMLLYTDGITEAIDRDANMFGIDRLIRMVQKTGEKSAEHLHDVILDAIKFYQKPDDVTLVVIKRLE